MKKLLLVGLFIIGISLVAAVVVIEEEETALTVTILQGNLTNLSELLDTDIPSPSDGFVLTFNATSGLWEDRSAASVGDTNETTRFNALVETDCVGEFVVGIQSNGTVLCLASPSAQGVSSIESGDLYLILNDSNNSIQITFNDTLNNLTILNISQGIHDQNLNTTNNVIFNNISVTENVSASWFLGFINFSDVQNKIFSFVNATYFFVTGDTLQLNVSAINGSLINNDLNWANQSQVNTSGDLRWLNLSGGNADQNIDIGAFEFSASSLNISGDSFLSTTNITVDFSDVSSLVIEDAFDGLSVKNLNPQGGTRIKAENDVGVRTTLFTTGSNATSVDATLVELANLTGLFTLGANMTLAVRSENMSIRMMVFNGTDLTDSLVINGDGSVLLQGPIFLEDENKSIDSEVINGGSGMVFSAIEILTGGETPFVWRAKTSDGSNVTLLGLQNGFNNSGGFWHESMIIASDYGFNSLSEIQNLTNCNFIVNQIGGTLRVDCNGIDNSSDLIVEGSIQLFETFFADGGSRIQGPSVFVLDGSDLDVFNGTLHIATPIDFVSGFSLGDERIVVQELFTAGLGGFVNLQTDIGDWISVPSGLCGDSPCAQADGSGLGNIIMEQNFSTSDINNTELSFVYSLVGLVGGDTFDVEMNNGSGFQTIFTDSGTDVVVQQNIDLGSDFDNISTVTLRVTCGVTAGKSGRQCFIDTIKLNGTSMSDTTANVSSFDSRIAMRDGAVDVDGNPSTGIYYIAENDTLFIRAGTVNITGLAGGGGGGIGGSGTTNSIPKFTATETLGNSNLIDNGVNVTSAIDFIIEGIIKALDWTNVTITESQISDLVHTTDTNASTACSGTTTYLDGENNCDDLDSVYILQSNEANLNVNNSNSTDFWSDFSSANTTQFENVGGILNFVLSFFSSEFDINFNTKDTDDLTEGSVNLYNNNTFNEPLTDSLYVEVTGDTMTGNLNLTSQNISAINCMVFDSGGQICSG